MTMPAPILRSPPFPGIDPEVGAVSRTAARSATHQPATLERAAALVEAIAAGRVGGTYWGLTPPATSEPGVVLRPVNLLRARDMAAMALAEIAADRIIALLPAAGWARSAQRELAAKGITAIRGEVDPWPLLRPGAVIHVEGSDELALLARIAGSDVCAWSSGIHAQAGHLPAPHGARGRDRLLNEVAAELIEGPRYRDPFSGRPASAEDVVALLSAWRTQLDANREIASVVGIAWWKRREIERFLWVGRERPLRFRSSARSALRDAQAADGAIAVWPSRMPATLERDAASAGIPLARIEDGFIRSVGLGADCRPPQSIVVDQGGIYFDPASGSDLERLIERGGFGADELDRARSVARTMVERGIAKYGADGQRPAFRREDRQRTVLVTGQVADDLSVRLGGGGVAGNLDLLARARAAELQARILFKPHPDVDAGHRAGAVPDQAALAHADEVVRGQSIATLFDQVDGVHVLTSLAGFEALLRGKDVTVHGQPFYAGWGLTRDLAPSMPQRSREATLEELVAATLILYPRYLDPVTGLPCPPEVLLERFGAQQRPRETWLTRTRHVQGRLAARLGLRKVKRA